MIKKSNIVLLFALLFLLTGVVANIYYHKRSFEPVKADYERYLAFRDAIDSIKIVRVEGVSPEIASRISIWKSSEFGPTLYVDGTNLPEKKELRELLDKYNYEMLCVFGKKYQLKGNLLILSGEIFKSLAQNKRLTFSLQLPHLQEVIINGKTKL